MKEIGEQFKEKREEIGITLEEVSSDLNKDIILVENLESGNHKVFKDIIDYLQPGDCLVRNNTKVLPARL